MARTKAFDERQALIAAMMVFWEKGYEATSIQDLEQAMGLKRTSIYNAFGNKRSLFGRVMTCYRESVMDALFAALDDAPTIREGISALLNAALDMHFDDANPGGCLLVLSVLESGQHDAVAQDALAENMRGLRQALQQRLTRAKQRGELRKDLDTGATATTIAGIMAGMMVLGKAKVTRAALKKTVNQVLRLLE
jgi:TetR/AcrR family transcriptional repressor of nem operon